MNTRLCMLASAALLAACGSNQNTPKASDGPAKSALRTPEDTGAAAGRISGANLTIDGALVPLIEIVPEGANFGDGEAFEP